MWPQWEGSSGSVDATQAVDSTADTQQGRDGTALSLSTHAVRDAYPCIEH